MIPELDVPHWGVSAVANLRRMYRDKYGYEYVGTDRQIWWVFQNVFDDSDKAKEDEARVEYLHD